MDTQQLETFLTVAKYLNFTVAARQLYITQPSLSRQIQELEKEFDTQLFYRDNRSVSLTAAGKVLFKEANLLISNLERLSALMKSTAAGELGQLRIGCLGLEKYFLPQLIKNFRQQYPKVSVQIDWSAGLSNHINLLLHEELDIIFTLKQEIIESPSIDSITLYKDPIMVVLPLDHPLIHNDSISMKDLANDSFIFLPYEDNPKSIQTVLDSCIKDGFYPHIALYSKSIESLFISIESGIGITVISKEMQNFAPKGVKFIPLANPSIFPVEIAAAWKKDNHNPTLPILLEKIRLLPEQMS
jgi:DNA-binding transcriptional LysR family regulator